MLPRYLHLFALMTWHAQCRLLVGSGSCFGESYSNASPLRRHVSGQSERPVQHAYNDAYVLVETLAKVSGRQSREPVLGLK